MVPRRIADGAIVVNASRPFAAEILAQAAAQGVPIVAVGSFGAGSYDVMQPRDEALAVAQAIDHLVEGGRRRFAFIGHLSDQSIPETRLASARQQLATHGLSLNDSWIRDGARDRNTAHAAAIDLLSQPGPPDAIVSASDIGGIATIWAAMRRGFGVPDDLAVVGCGNIEECLITVPTLSSAGPPSMDFSRIAFQMIDRLAHPTRPAELHTVERWAFFRRESS
jgi:DNA-binding LacI/PurR family transcriptional regulator